MTQIYLSSYLKVLIRVEKNTAVTSRPSVKSIQMSQGYLRRPWGYRGILATGGSCSLRAAGESPHRTHYGMCQRDCMQGWDLQGNHLGEGTEVEKGRDQGGSRRNMFKIRGKGDERNQLTTTKWLISMLNLTSIAEVYLIFPLNPVSKHLL